MKLERLKITNYRNIKELELIPGEGVNVIYGSNAQGKTNLLEAIYLFTGQKSFRQSREADLVMRGEQMALLEADFFAGGRPQTATMQLGGKKSATLNEVTTTPAELTGRFYAVVFSPAELAMVQAGPALRRSFLDCAISQVMPRYIKTLSAMNRALFQRNSLLSDMRARPGMEDFLDAWDKSFAKLAAAVINARRRYISRLAPHARSFYEGISAGREQLTIEYKSSLELNWEENDNAKREREIIELLRRSRGEDLRSGFTNLGPQRDDLELCIDENPARNFGSQGQQRSCALALKLAECRLLGEICGEPPILLLDDLFSELDKGRRDYFLSGINEGQIFITACEKSTLRGFGNGKKFEISSGTLVPPRRRKRKC